MNLFSTSKILYADKSNIPHIGESIRQSFVTITPTRMSICVLLPISLHKFWD